jgi:Acetyltransferase (GNAT) domain
LISVRCFESLPEAAHLREQVNALNRRSAQPDPFSTFEFFENYLLHDDTLPPGGSLHLWFLAAFRAEQLVGYLVLKRVTRGTWLARFATLSFLVTHNTDRPHLVACAEDLHDTSAAIYNHLLGRRREWALLELHQQDASSPLFPPPTAADLSGHWVSQWPSLPNCTIHVRWTTLRDYVEALDKKFRSNLGRQMRHLLAAGRLELLSSSDPLATPALLGLYRGIEPRSWKSLADASIGAHPQRIAYFEGLLQAHQPMRVSIQILLLDGVPIAGLVNGSFANGLYALHIVYDEAFSRFTPGSAMLLLGMRQAIDGGCAFFNLLSGFDYYKARWLAQASDTRIAQIYRVGTLPHWHRKLGDWKRALFPAHADPLRALFNPLRRKIGRRQQASGGLDNSPAVAIAPAQRLEWIELIAAVRRNPGDSLSTAALAAVLQIETQAASRAKPVHAS